jgi:hypothetical protein
VGGKSDDVTVGYWYYVGMHMVLCHGPVDAITGIKVDKKIAWMGDHDGGEITINAPELFGGESREGGIEGAVDFDFGGPAQTPNTYLESVLDVDVPAFRGVVSAILKQVNIGLNPYMKPWEFRLQRIHTTTGSAEQWYDAKAAIANPDICPNVVPALAVYIALDLSASMDTVVSGSTTRLDNAKVAINGFLDYIDDMLGWVESVDICLVGWSTTHSTDIVRDVDSAAITALKAVVSAYVTTGQTDFEEAVTEVNSFFAGLASATARYFLFVTDGVPWVGDGLTESEKIIMCESAQSTLFSTANLYAYGFNIDLVSTAYTAYLDNTDSDGVPVLVGTDPAALTNSLKFALFTGYPAGLDMNPAHIIRECLTDTEWGMGYPSADIDSASFEAAADTLYSESMGMSLLWTKQTKIEDFVKEILKHVNAALYTSKATGKFVLKLIRDDYSVGALTTLGEDDIIKVASAKRPSLGEMVNSVTVQYWDTCTGNTASVTVTDQALVIMQGNEINTTTQYPGFTNKTTAAKVALRDLRVLSAPLLICTLEATRLAADLNLGDAVIIDWPDLEIVNLVMRVTKISFGDGRNNRVKLDLAEDVFGYTNTAPTEQGDSDPAWVDPNQPPVAPENRLVLEAPYYELIQRIGSRDATDFLADEADLGYVVAAAARPGAAIKATLSIDSGAGYEDVGLLDFCFYAELATAVDETETTLEYKNGVDIDLIAVGEHMQLGDEIVRIDTIDTSAEEIEVGRGALDTVPALHAVDAEIFGWDAYHGADSTEYIDSDEVDVKIRPTTGGGTLLETQAYEDTIILDGRAIRPYPPGKLQIDAAYYPTGDVSAASIDVTWAHRDRVQQTDGVLYDHTEGDIGPEAGTTYRVQVIDDGDVVQIDHSGISITSQTVDLTSLFNAEHTLIVRSERDGYVSWQDAEWAFNYAVGVPLQVDGLVLWLDGADINSLYQDSAKTTPVTSDDDPVGCWADKSGNGYDYTQSTLAYRPAYKTGILNSLAIVRGNGVDASLGNYTKANWVFLHDTTQKTIIIVFKTASANPDSHQYLLGNNIGTPSNVGTCLFVDDRSGSSRNDNMVYQVTRGVAGQGTISAKAGNDTYPSSTAQIVQVEYEYDRSGDDCEFYKDGVSVNTVESNAHIPVSSEASYNLKLFATGGSPTTFTFDGDIAEVIIYDNIISSGDRTTITDYLKAKWGVS